MRVVNFMQMLTIFLTEGQTRVRFTWGNLVLRSNGMMVNVQLDERQKVSEPKVMPAEMRHKLSLQRWNMADETTVDDHHFVWIRCHVEDVTTTAVSTALSRVLVGDLPNGVEII